MTLKELQSLLGIRGIECSDLQASQLESYMFYVLEENEKTNLTAIKDRDSFMNLMIFDSALPLTLTDFNNKKIIDIGTGAGFPGTVIQTLTENSEVTLLDSTKKKIDIINRYEGYPFKTVHARAEEFGRANREKYDIAVARAVSEFSIILELALPLVKVGGYFIALKGPGAEREIKKAEKALKKLNAHIEKTESINLPTGEKRVNILVKKDYLTPSKFPRDYKEIKKNPL